MRRPSDLARSSGGATAAEFALVLPLLLILLLGMIDVGRFMWEYNKAEKATQMGARMAIVTDAVSPDLIAADFASSSIKPGELIPASALGTVTCTSSGCACTTSPCPFSSGGVASAPMTAIVTRMQNMKGDIQAANVKIAYSGSGFGYAEGTSPGGGGGGGGGGGVAEKMEVSPLVTVSLTGITFTPIMLLGLVDLDLPAFSATLTAEDISGSYSN